MQPSNIVPSVLEIFYTFRKQASLVLVVFYRGSWCSVCREWIAEWLRIPHLEEYLAALDGVLLFVSSQEQGDVNALFNELKKPTRNTRVVAVGDPENSLAADLRRKDGLLDLTVSGSPGPYTTHGYVYPRGMVQPGCLVMDTRKSSGVLYSWESVPGILNMSGKFQRPAPSDVWRYAVSERNLTDHESDVPKLRTWKYLSHSSSRKRTSRTDKKQKVT